MSDGPVPSFEQYIDLEQRRLQLEAGLAGGTADTNIAGHYRRAIETLEDQQAELATNPDIVAQALTQGESAMRALVELQPLVGILPEAELASDRQRYTGRITTVAHFILRHNLEGGSDRAKGFIERTAGWAAVRPNVQTVAFDEPERPPVDSPSPDLGGGEPKDEGSIGQEKPSEPKLPSPEEIIERMEELLASLSEGEDLSPRAVWERLFPDIPATQRVTGALRNAVYKNRGLPTGVTHNGEGRASFYRFAGPAEVAVLQQQAAERAFVEECLSVAEAQAMAGMLSIRTGLLAEAELTVLDADATDALIAMSGNTQARSDDDVAALRESAIAKILSLAQDPQTTAKLLNLLEGNDPRRELLWYFQEQGAELPFIMQILRESRSNLVTVNKRGDVLEVRAGVTASSKIIASRRRVLGAPMQGAPQKGADVRPVPSPQQSQPKFERHEVQGLESGPISSSGISYPKGTTFVGPGSVRVNAEVLPTADREAEVATKVIRINGNTFAIGNAVGSSRALADIAESQLAGKISFNQRADQTMVDAVKKMLNGDASSVIMMNNLPGVARVYCVRTTNSARAFFADLGIVDGERTFLKIAAAASRVAEQQIVEALINTGKYRRAN